MNLAFLADENVEIDIVDRLKSLGHTAAHASELSHGRPDTAMLQAASHLGWWRPPNHLSEVSSFLKHSSQV